MKRSKAAVNFKGQTVREILLDQLRERFDSIASQATRAKRVSPTKEDVFCDLVDDIDNDLQAAVELINRLRGDEA